MINVDDVTKENIKEHYPHHSYRMLIIGGSGSRKTNSLYIFISQQPDIDKIYLYTKDPNEAEYQLLINKRKSTDLNYFNSKAFSEYSNDMDGIYKNIEEYNQNKKRKILVVFFMIWLLICLVIKNLIQ